MLRLRSNGATSSGPRVSFEETLRSSITRGPIGLATKALVGVKLWRKRGSGYWGWAYSLLSNLASVIVVSRFNYNHQNKIHISINPTSEKFNRRRKKTLKKIEKKVWRRFYSKVPVVFFTLILSWEFSTGCRTARHSRFPDLILSKYYKQFKDNAIFGRKKNIQEKNKPSD